MEVFVDVLVFPVVVGGGPKQLQLVVVVDVLVVPISTVVVLVLVFERFVLVVRVVDVLVVDDERDLFVPLKVLVV